MPTCVLQGRMYNTWSLVIQILFLSMIMLTVPAINPREFLVLCVKFVSAFVFVFFWLAVILAWRDVLLSYYRKTIMIQHQVLLFNLDRELIAICTTVTMNHGRVRKPCGFLEKNWSCTELWQLEPCGRCTWRSGMMDCSISSRTTHPASNVRCLCGWSMYTWEWSLTFSQYRKKLYIWNFCGLCIVLSMFRLSDH